MEMDYFTDIKIFLNISALAILDWNQSLLAIQAILCQIYLVISQEFFSYWGLWFLFNSFFSGELHLSCRSEIRETINLVNIYIVVVEWAMLIYHLKTCLQNTVIFPTWLALDPHSFLVAEYECGCAIDNNTDVLSLCIITNAVNLRDPHLIYLLCRHMSVVYLTPFFWCHPHFLAMMNIKIGISAACISILC